MNLLCGALALRGAERTKRGVRKDCKALPKVACIVWARETAKQRYSERKKSPFLSFRERRSRWNFRKLSPGAVPAAQ